MNEEQRIALVDRIYEWIMSNEDMGMGESADARYEADKIVRGWELDLKLNLERNEKSN